MVHGKFIYTFVLMGGWVREGDCCTMNCICVTTLRVCKYIYSNMKTHAPDMGVCQGKHGTDVIFH